jgi:hypothetical protein
MIGVGWRDFVPLVRLSTAKCPISAIVAQLRDAAREFCAATRCWAHVSEACGLLAGEGVYGLRPPGQADVSAVLTVRACGATLLPLTPDQWRTLEPATHRHPTHFTVTEPGLVHLYPTPNEDVPAALVVTAALQPSVSSAQGPQFLLTKYGQTIAKGAQARLLFMPDRPWSDPQTGALLAREFADGMAGARINIDRGGADAPSRVKYRPFF